MGIGDWFLSRSEAFRLLMIKFRDHKHDTISGFSKVKSKHRAHDKKFEEHSARLKILEEFMELLQEQEEEAVVKVKKKKK